ncbi:MAG: pyruvate/2-oxoglutarate dehydrogenase complex dihydrolipoamide acyltransferase (E2) component, partial [Alphaproteobacteria bacterium]
MATQIIIPEMGESVTEGTIARWFKQVGDTVAIDEPLVEVETDKVTVEIPAPAAGTLSEIAAEEGTDVAVGAIIGAIAEGEGAIAAPVKRNGTATAPEPTPTPAASPEPQSTPAPVQSAAPSGETVDITVPEMGESVTEGTVGRWLKSIGDAVAMDEALVEIETDKVTAELPAPVAGTLSAILAEEGTDVEVGSIVGQIAAGASAAAAVSAPAATPTPAPAPVPAPTPAATTAANLDYPLAPAVRKLIDENGLDPAGISASGKDGRLTKADVLAHIAGGAKAKPAPAATVVAPAAGFVPASEMPERTPDPRGEE